MAAQPNASGQTTALAHDPAQALARYPTFEHALELIRSNRDVKLLVDYGFNPSRIGAPNDRAHLGAKNAKAGRAF